MITRKKLSSKQIPDAVKAKWPVEILDEGFTPFPKRLTRCLPKVFSGPHAAEDLAVILAIVDYRRPDLSRAPSVEYLAFIAGMEPVNFLRRVGDLIERGWITREGPDESVTFEIKGLLERIKEETAEDD